MMWLTIGLDVLRHAWRMKLPMVLLLSVFMIIVSLPIFIVSDGSLEGKVKLFFLYGGHLQTVMLSLLAVIWTVWFENLEQKNNVHCMIAVKPVSRLSVLTARLFGNYAILMSFFVVISLCIGYMGERLVKQSDATTEQKTALFNKLNEVREKKALTFIGDVKYQGKFINANRMRVVPLDHAKKVSYQVELPDSVGDYEIEGYLGANSSQTRLNIVWLMRKGKEPLGEGRVVRFSNNAFVIRVPADLAKYSPVQLDIIQLNKNKERMYILKEKPFSLTIPVGGVMTNMVMASIQLSFLALCLIALSIFFSQFLSLQSSLFVSLAVFMGGYFRENIHEMLFPVQKIIEGMEQTVVPNSFGNIFYTVLWKPILFIIPDFSRLNPSSALSNGEWISWYEILTSLYQVIPFLLFLYVILLYRLPKQELGKPI